MEETFSRQNRIKLLHKHFNFVPFSNCSSFYKICLILAQNKDIAINDDGNFFEYNHHVFSTFNFVLYAYHRKLKLNKVKEIFEQVCVDLKILKLL